MDYILDRDRSMDPSLPEMTRAALKILTRDRDGYFLLVEGKLNVDQCQETVLKDCFCCRRIN